MQCSVSNININRLQKLLSVKGVESNFPQRKSHLLDSTWLIARVVALAVERQNKLRMVIPV